jgi:hypothetical protein
MCIERPLAAAADIASSRFRPGGGGELSGELHRFRVFLVVLTVHVPLPVAGSSSARKPNPISANIHCEHPRPPQRNVTGSPRFEIDPGWVPSLDGRDLSARKQLLSNELIRFERTTFYAARVLNASSVGSQKDRLELSLAAC